MKNIFGLAFQSWRARRISVFLSIGVIALSVGLLLSIEQLRRSVRNSFAQTISGTDLIVGARGGSTELLLYSVFHIGIFAITFFTLPFIAKKPIDVPPVISIDLIQISEKTALPFAPKARKIIEKVKEEEIDVIGFE